MNTKIIINYLQDIAANNNKEWYQANKNRYDEARKEFNTAIDDVIHNIGKFDASVSHLTAKDCVFRFYRDIRFSPDKSPYKRHFGAYISAKGRKSLHGGYYLHCQPGNCFIGAGAYWLPTNILTACRNEIMANIDMWRKAVENGKFIKFFGYAGGNNMQEHTDGDPLPVKGFGITYLKKAPKGFPKDYEFMDYLRMKDYSCWHRVDDDFFGSEGWMKETMTMFNTAKPMMDFMNSVIDDYE
jgi:uncharacterized protein (TIGR02453 family)